MSLKSSLKDTLQAFAQFSRREQRRVLLLLPLLTVICLLFLWQDKPRIEHSFTQYTDAVLDTAKRAERTPARHGTQAAGGASGSTATSRSKPVEPFLFDPNTIDKEGLVALGFSPKQAQGILNYRAAGAIFRHPTDFARCYTVSAEKYAELEPYIRIGKADAAAGGAAKPAPSSAADFAADEQSLRDGLRSVPERLPAAPALLELNGADSASLVALRGIGALTAGRIVRYRQRLGGFVSESQLREIVGMTDENYGLILQQIFIDSSKIQKIDINFAPLRQLAGHPYLPPRTIDRILKNRQLKGGWRNTGELTEDHTLTEEQAARLAPYLRFEIRGSEQSNH